MCDMIQSICVTFVCVTWLIHKRRWFHIIDSYVACKIVQGDEDAYDALYCRSLSAKEPTIIGLFCRQYRLKIRHPTYLRHPVWVMAHVRMSHGTCVTWSSPYVWEWVMSHVRDESCHTCACDIYGLDHVTHVTWLILTCAQRQLSHGPYVTWSSSYAWHAPFFWAYPLLSWVVRGSF